MYELDIVQKYANGKITKEQLDEMSTCDLHARVNNGLSEASEAMLLAQTGEEIVDNDLRNQFQAKEGELR